MKQRSMFVTDMLDLDNPKASADIVWCASRPKAVRCDGGDAVLTVPFLAAKRSGIDIAPLADKAPKEYQVRVRAHGESVVRVMVGFDKALLADTNPMLSFAPSMNPVELSVETTSGGWVVRDARGIRRFEISTADAPIKPWKEGESVASQTDFAATAYPDGDAAVPFETSTASTRAGTSRCRSPWSSARASRTGRFSLSRPRPTSASPARASASPD